MLSADVLAMTFAASPDVVIAADAEGRVRFANAAAREVLPELREGARLRDHVDAVAAHEGKGPARFDWIERSPAGVRRFHLCSLTPLDGGYLFVASDATALKQSEERLRRSEELMVDTQGTAHLGTWEWDVSQPHATWSAELYRIYGLTPDEYTPSYERYLTMVHPDDRQRVIDATNKVFHEHVPYSHDERIFRPDGSMRYLHTWARPALDENGKLVRLIGVCQDITERRLAEDHVRQMNVDLERRVADRTRVIETSLRDIEAFNAQVSHDLRAPLGVIGGSISLLRDTALDEKAQKHLARIERSVALMTALVNDLLTLAHVGNAKLERVPMDLSAMCEEIVAALRQAGPERRVTVRIEPDIQVVGDPVLVRTALDNLLGNAWKYSSRVESAVIDVATSDGERGRVIFVRDNGAGFDMKDAPRLFAPFERLHKATEFEGTGVGLAAVHRIVERHGGRIWAESEPGKGATFYVELPETTTGADDAVA